MQHIKLIAANTSHLAILLPMVRDYHAFEKIVLNDEQRANALSPLLNVNSEHGRIWLIKNNDAAIGYIALCFGYSIEFCGRDAFIDELFVISSERGKGVGRYVLEQIKHYAADLNIAALHLEVAHHNQAAKSLYSGLGFVPREKMHLMSYTVPSTRDIQ